ncbi:MAG: SH3 domain-containing protein [Anaerolineae bacterium]|nr:SH3 domain-containing protein [Anaerolineae bacterium]
MEHNLRKITWVLLVLLFSVAVVTAQDNTCPAFVNQALASLDTNCGGLGRNQACYSYDRVEAAFLNPVPEDFFSKPADVTGVADLQTIRTTPLDTTNNTWGLAVMNLQANLPNTLPGQNVTFVLMGDVDVENAVAPDAAYTPSDGIAVIANVAAGANVRSGPGLNFNVIGAVQSGDSVQADGLSVDGGWLRVAFRDRPGWISRSVIADAPGIADLPTLTADLRTPMQAFYLQTRVGETQCTEAPDSILLVQGPKNVEIQLTVNGAEVVLHSTGAFRTVQVDGKWFLEIVVFDGEFNVDGVTIRTGQHSLVCLGDGETPDRHVSCKPTPPENVPGFGADWCLMEQVPGGILHYGINILCPGETPPVGGGGHGQGASPSQLPGVSCDQFALISPLGSADSGDQHFQWTPVSGDGIEYELVFYNYLGQQAETFRTPNTFYDVNLGSQTSTGGAFSWEVRAYQNGQYACVSYRSPQMGREDIAAPVAGFSAHAVCGYSGPNYSATVSWNNAPGTPVVVEWQDLGGGSGNPSSNDPSGSLTITTSYYFYTFSYIKVKAGGQTINLGGC